MPNNFLFVVLSLMISVFCVGVYIGERQREFKKFNEVANRNSEYYRYGLLACLALIVVFILFYIKWSEPQIQFSELAKIGAGLFAVITLVFAALNYNFAINKNEEEIRLKRSSTTLDQINNWYKAPLAEYSMEIRNFEQSPEYNLLKSDLSSFMHHYNKTEKLHQAIVGIFNYFEILCSAYTRNLLDKEYLERYFRSLMILYYDDWIEFINKKRNDEKYHELWEDFN